MTTKPAPLLRTEARDRAALISVDLVDVDLDLTTGESGFASRTRIEFTCRRPGASTWLDFRPREAGAVVLNGRTVDLEDAADEVARRGSTPLAIAA